MRSKDKNVHIAAETRDPIKLFSVFRLRLQRVTRINPLTETGTEICYSMQLLFSVTLIKCRVVYNVSAILNNVTVNSWGFGLE